MANTSDRKEALGVSEAEWQARVDLAAAYRLAEEYGWSALIYNHITLRIPDQPRHFLIKPHKLLFDEVKASNLVKLSMDGDRLNFADDVNPAVFSLHASILRAKPNINGILHTHTKAGSAMSAHGKGLLPISQGAMRFYGLLAYHDYGGFAEKDEDARIVADLGENVAMILRNHGILVVAETASTMITRASDLLEAFESQLLLEASGAPITLPPPEVCEHTAKAFQSYDKKLWQDDWAAYLRKLDRVDPSYRD